MKVDDEDAFALATSEIVVACTSAQRWFDLDAVRTEYAEITLKKKGAGDAPQGPKAERIRSMKEAILTHAGAPPLDWWKDPWPVVRDRLTAAMCPREVCRTCGEPRRRITEHTQLHNGVERTDDRDLYTNTRGEDQPRGEFGPKPEWVKTSGAPSFSVRSETLGWSDCGHDNYRTGIVLDPFDLSESSNVPAHYIVGDVFDALAKIPDNSVDLILTSPPFLALRSYLPADHPDKAKEIGSEATPADFIDTLLDLTVEWRRVLAPHGSICIELGDTYSGSGGAGGDYAEGGMREGQEAFDGSARRTRPVKASPDAQSHRNMGEGVVALTGGRGWPLPKSLCMIPELYRLSLGYGRNILRPERIIEPWRVRNVVRWCRPNPPVGALGDKFRPGTSDMVVACTSAQRWFDLDAVRTEHNPNNHRPADLTAVERQRKADANPMRKDGPETYNSGNPAGAPPLDWWQVSTEPYAGSHYATWPRKLLTRPILAMCPLAVCRTCGEPRRRITETERTVQGRSGDGRPMSGSRGDPRTMDTYESSVGTFGTIVTTLGWSDCGHDNYRTGIVLDPFAGSGTTLAVATGHGRDAIGIDLDSRNLELARERIGPLFFTEGSPFDVDPAA